jgi:hypothetical protein
MGSSKDTVFLNSELATWVADGGIESGALLLTPAFAQELALDVAGLALAVSVFVAGFVSAGADLLPESLDLESPLLESPDFVSLAFDSLLEELSDESLPELPFDA